MTALKRVRTNCLICFCLLITLGITGCGNSYKSAIQNVLQQDNAFSSQIDTDSIDSIRQYTANMRSINLSSCPPEFRQAYISHIQAWEQAIYVLESLPQSFEESLLVGFLNGLAGDITGGAADYNDAINQCQVNIEQTWQNVEQIAAYYDAL